MTGQLNQVGATLANALRLWPSVGEPGYPSPGEVASGLAAVLRTRLGPSERLTVANAAVMSLNAETAEMLAEATLSDLCAGQPAPPFDGIRTEAKHWATFASRGELRAYLAAIWHRLPEPERRSFIRAARPAKRRAAA